jgi:NAD(P)H-hydrate repair Nnr-like enzyme with NAD(P)H-hydrate dehydratase domain
VLAGTIGTFNAWAQLNGKYVMNFSRKKKIISLFLTFRNMVALPDEISPMMIAAYGGCALTRESSRLCFSHKKRSMVAHDIVGCLGESFWSMYDHHNL